MSPDSTYHNWIIGSKCREDTEHAVLIAAPISLTAFGENSVIVWDGIYQDAILQPVAVPYLHSLGLNSTFRNGED